MIPIIIDRFFVDVKALDTINDGSKNSKFSILELITLKSLFVSFFKFIKIYIFFYLILLNKVFETPKIDKTAPGNPAPEPKSIIFPLISLQNLYS